MECRGTILVHSRILRQFLSAGPFYRYHLLILKMCRHGGRHPPILLFESDISFGTYYTRVALPCSSRSVMLGCAVFLRDMNSKSFFLPNSRRRPLDNFGARRDAFFMTPARQIPQRAHTTEHLLLLCMALAILVAAFCCRIEPGGIVFFRLPVIGVDIPLVDGCLSRRMLGVSCPGCGLTRSFVAVAHGQFRLAVEYNAVGPALFILCMLQIPYRIWAYFREDRVKGRLKWVHDRLGAIIWVAAAALFFFWAYRLVAGFFQSGFAIVSQ